jgi:hypothetical protein
LTKSELEGLTIEISILTPPEKVEKIEDIQVGVHGLILSRGFHQGLLLPQVPLEQGWNREQFLDQTCRKAGLPAECWRDGAGIMSFKAQVFGEEKYCSKRRQREKSAKGSGKREKESFLRFAALAADFAWLVHQAGFRPRRRGPSPGGAGIRVPPPTPESYARPAMFSANLINKKSVPTMPNQCEVGPANEAMRRRENRVWYYYTLFFGRALP